MEILKNFYRKGNLDIKKDLPKLIGRLITNKGVNYEKFVKLNTYIISCFLIRFKDFKTRK